MILGVIIPGVKVGATSRSISLTVMSEDIIRCVCVLRVRDMQQTNETGIGTGIRTRIRRTRNGSRARAGAGTGGGSGFRFGLFTWLRNPDDLILLMSLEGDNGIIRQSHQGCCC